MNGSAASKTAAERQRLRRERRRFGLRCVTVTVSDEAIAALEDAGLLDDQDLGIVLAEVLEEAALTFARENGSVTRDKCVARGCTLDRDQPE